MNTVEQKHFMRLALDASARALPHCLPNPPVGCVLVRNGQVIATGYTRAPGGFHAEADALSQVQGSLQGVSAFVTLEPCSFHGRTPSCAKTLVERGISAVYVGLTDPDPRNNGLGLEILRSAGVKVVEQVHAGAVSGFLQPFLGRQSLRIRRATAQDAQFLARIILLATRAHLARGWFDILLDADESTCLDFIARLTQTNALSWWHHSRFWISEVDDECAAALCSFRAGDAYPLSGAAIAEVVNALQWSSDVPTQMWQRGSYIFACSLSGGDDAWTIENVAVLPQYRGRGLVAALLQCALAENQSHPKTQVTTCIGNAAAITAYQRAGFALVEEKHCDAFAQVTGSPGLCRFEKMR